MLASISNIFCKAQNAALEIHVRFLIGECTRGCESSFNYRVECRKSFTNQLQLKKNCLCTISWICFTSHHLSQVVFTLKPLLLSFTIVLKDLLSSPAPGCYRNHRDSPASVKPGLCSDELFVPPWQLSFYGEPPKKPWTPWWAQITSCTGVCQSGSDVCQ